MCARAGECEGRVGMPIKAQLFITCLAEQFFPDVLTGMVGLLERLGVQVAFPEAQTCCGQPFFNSGYRDQAREMAVKWLEVFGSSDGYIVSPPATCCGASGCGRSPRRSSPRSGGWR